MNKLCCLLFNIRGDLLRAGSCYKRFCRLEGGVCQPVQTSPQNGGCSAEKAARY